VRRAEKNGSCASFLLSYSHPTAPSLNPLTTRFRVQQHEYELQFDKIEEIKQRPVKVWQSSMHAAFTLKDEIFWFLLFCKVVLKQ